MDPHVGGSVPDHEEEEEEEASSGEEEDEEEDLDFDSALTMQEQQRQQHQLEAEMSQAADAEIRAAQASAASLRSAGGGALLTSGAPAAGAGAPMPPAQFQAEDKQKGLKGKLFGKKKKKKDKAASSLANGTASVVLPEGYVAPSGKKAKKPKGLPGAETEKKKKKSKPKKGQLSSLADGTASVVWTGSGGLSSAGSSSVPLPSPLGPQGSGSVSQSGSLQTAQRGAAPPTPTSLKNGALGMASMGASSQDGESVASRTGSHASYYRNDSLSAAPRPLSRTVSATGSDASRGHHVNKEAELQAFVRMPDEYDNVLRESFLLQKDLIGALDHVKRSQEMMAVDSQAVEAKMGAEFDDADGWEVFTELLRLQGQLEGRLHAAEKRVDPLSWAVKELQAMQDFVRGTRPSHAHAKLLQEEVIQEVLSRLHRLGIDLLEAPDFSEGADAGSLGEPVASPTSNRPRLNPDQVEEMRERRAQELMLQRDQLTDINMVQVMAGVQERVAGLDSAAAGGGEEDPAALREKWGQQQQEVAVQRQVSVNKVWEAAHAAAAAVAAAEAAAKIEAEEQARISSEVAKIEAENAAAIARWQAQQEERKEAARMDADRRAEAVRRQRAQMAAEEAERERAARAAFLRRQQELEGIEAAHREAEARKAALLRAEVEQRTRANAGRAVAVAGAGGAIAGAAAGAAVARRKTLLTEGTLAAQTGHEEFDAALRSVKAPPPAVPTAAAAHDDFDAALKLAAAAEERKRAEKKRRAEQARLAKVVEAEEERQAAERKAAEDARTKQAARQSDADYAMAALGLSAEVPLEEDLAVEASANSRTNRLRLTERPSIRRAKDTEVEASGPSAGRLGREVSVDTRRFVRQRPSGGSGSTTPPQGHASNGNGTAADAAAQSLGALAIGEPDGDDLEDLELEPEVVAPAQGGAYGGGASLAAAQPKALSIRRAPQVAALYYQLYDEEEAEGQGGAVARAPAPEVAAWRSISYTGSDDVAPVDRGQVAQDMELYGALVRRLSGDVARFSNYEPAEVAAFVERIQEQMPAEVHPIALKKLGFPEERFNVLRDSATLHRELPQMIQTQQAWLLHNEFSCPDECTRIETYFDIVVQRAEEEDSVKASFTAAGVPWDAEPLYQDLRLASLNLGEVYMARVLSEVAALDRGASPQYGRCLGFLSDAVRMAFRVHNFVGGFNRECSELFETVRHLVDHYKRAVDPTWLRAAKVL